MANALVIENLRARRFWLNRRRAEGTAKTKAPSSMAEAYHDFAGGSGLELYVQGELQNARIEGRRDLPVCPRTDVRVDIAEARVVEYVEELAPELHARSFFDGERFVQSPVPDVFKWAANDSNTGVAEESEWRRDEGVGAEPLVYSGEDK